MAPGGLDSSRSGRGLGLKPQRIAVVATLLFLVLVIELVRRRRLVERYALLWISAAMILVMLGRLGRRARTLATPSGILSPPNALFLIGLGALFFLALHFSVAFSRLSEETKILAQEVARLDREQRRIRHGSLSGEEDVVIGTVESRRRTAAPPGTSHRPQPQRFDDVQECPAIFVRYARSRSRSAGVSGESISASALSAARCASASRRTPSSVSSSR